MEGRESYMVNIPKKIGTYIYIYIYIYKKDQTSHNTLIREINMANC